MSSNLTNCSLSSVPTALIGAQIKMLCVRVVVAQAWLVVASHLRYCVCLSGRNLPHNQIASVTSDDANAFANLTSL